MSKITLAAQVRISDSDPTLCGRCHLKPTYDDLCRCRLFCVKLKWKTGHPHGYLRCKKCVDAEVSVD